MGEHDLPIQIEYVRDYTQQDKISYVGHSLGTTQMFYALSMFPDYFKERINLFVALAPAVRLD